jgi:hypothetical protein
MRYHLSEIQRYTIPTYELDRFSPDVQRLLSRFEDIELYPYERLKDMSSDDMVAEFKRRVREFLDVRKKHGNEESNEEGMCLSSMAELFAKMMIQDARRLGLEKLL